MGQSKGGVCSKTKQWILLRMVGVIILISLFFSIIIVSVALTESYPGDLVNLRRGELFSIYFQVQNYDDIIYGIVINFILLSYFLVSLSLLMCYGYGIYVVYILFKTHFKKEPSSPPMQRKGTNNDSEQNTGSGYGSGSNKSSSSYNGRVKNRRSSSAAENIPIQGISPHYHEINSLRDIRNRGTLETQTQSYDPVLSHPTYNYRHSPDLDTSEILSNPEYKPLIDEATRQIKLISLMKNKTVQVEPPPITEDDNDFGSDTEDFEYHAFPTPNSLNNNERERLLKFANQANPEREDSAQDI